MTDQVTLTIDGVEVSVPQGMVIVDAAKRAGNDIPVFCYHPKLDPVGMCRMCLVEVGLPVRNRETGQIELDEQGQPRVNFGRTLQTGCTVQVSEGMVVRTSTDVVRAARDDILEFLLTSHPLDCPICDKGGECPLQDLTMRHGPGRSRFDYDNKMHLAKRVPLGELIVLDRERCIQCARCTRFQDEIVADPVIAFHNRGRHLEIITVSEPGFDSIFSGNTTDICPVGALTSSDFRFEARPWELTPVASICPHCPVGCNTTLSTRTEARSAGRKVIKRIMPRQNERVNEIWICDKGRFVHHFADAPDRLTGPLVREGDRLVETSWDTALDLVAGRLQMAKPAVAGLANDRLSNEDLYMFQKLFRQGLGSNNVDLADRRVGGGEVLAQVGVARESNLGELGQGDAILVVAADLHQQAPVWWLRVKQAAERGATLVVLNVRPTRLDRYANYVFHYRPGHALTAVRQLVNAARIDTGAPDDDPFQAAGDALVQASNLVAFYGGEGLSYEESDALARMLGNLLLLKQENGAEGGGHAGRRNNGLIAVWPRGNTQGAWDMGIAPHLKPGYEPVAEPGLGAEAILAAAADGSLKALYLLGADPIGDGQMSGRGGLDFLVVQELFLTESAKAADVVLPAQSWAEREGTFTNGERRVQRFYPAISVSGDSRADWQILAHLGERVGLGKPAAVASLAFGEIAANVALYKDLSYRALAWTEEQWPIIGGRDLFYGGTAFANKSGLGLQWPAAAESGRVERFDLPDLAERAPEGLALVEVTALYEPGTVFDHTHLLEQRRAEPALFLNAADGQNLGIADGETVRVAAGDASLEVPARVDGQAPAGVALLSGARLRRGRAPVSITRVT